MTAPGVRAPRRPMAWRGRQAALCLYQVLPSTSNRWSFSWPGANMSAATVSITKDGQSVAVLGYDSRDNLGYGDASVVFRPKQRCRIRSSGLLRIAGRGGSVLRGHREWHDWRRGAIVGHLYRHGNRSVREPGRQHHGDHQQRSERRRGRDILRATCRWGNFGTASNASGAYSCTVPTGWSGKLHSPMVGTNFIPAQSFASVTGPVSRNVSATSGVPGCNLDVDNNGLFDPATDGVAILRRIAGFGQSSFAGLAGACAANVTAASIHGAAGASLTGGGYNVTGGSSTLTTTDGWSSCAPCWGLTGSPVISGLGPSLESGANQYVVE